MKYEQYKTQSALILILWLITNFISDNSWINSTALVTAFVLVTGVWTYLENKELKAELESEVKK